MASSQRAARYGRPLGVAGAGVVLVVVLAMLAPRREPSGDAGGRSEVVVTIDTLGLARRARFLASDSLRGRGAGSRGERMAAEYLAGELRSIGASPVGALSGYLQPFELTSVTVDESKSRLVVSFEGRTATLRPPAFYHRGGARASFTDFDGPVVFAGPVGTAAQAAGRFGDLRGHVVLVTADGRGDLGALVRTLTDRGAAAMVVAVPVAPLYERIRNARGPVRFALEHGVDDPANQARIPSLILGPDALGELPPLPAPPTAAPVEARLLPWRMRSDIAYHMAPARSQNVAGLIEGRDEGVRGEYVIVMAHYDHVGIGVPRNGDSVYNGFVDNAVGAATVLGIGEALRAAAPRRSVILLLTGSEEQGLLGASAFLASRVVAPGRIAGVVNIDAGMPPIPPRGWVLAGGDQSFVGEVAQAVAAERGWTVELAPARNDSDHYAFLAQGLPAAFPIPGSPWEGVDDAAGDSLFVAANPAHQPGDEWHAGVAWSGMARHGAFVLALTRALADRDGLPSDRPRDSSVAP